MESLVSKKLKHWYIPLILGIVFIALGISIFFSPTQVFLPLATLFSLGFLFSGIIEVYYSTSNRKETNNWGWFLASGILTIFIGILMFVRLDLTMLMIFMYLGFWMLFKSVMYISFAFELKRERVERWGWVLVFGIIGMIISFIMLSNPLITGIALAYWLSFGFILIGAINIILSYSAKRVKKEIDSFINV